MCAVHEVAARDSSEANKSSTCPPLWNCSPATHSPSSLQLMNYANLSSFRGAMHNNSLGSRWGRCWRFEERRLKDTFSLSTGHLSFLRVEIITRRRASLINQILRNEVQRIFHFWKFNELSRFVNQQNSTTLWFARSFVILNILQPADNCKEFISNRRLEALISNL